MRAARLATLKFFALVFLLAGLIASAAISTHYLVVMPQKPAPEELRVIPRSIHGVTVYQTEKENRLLNTWEFTAVGIFLAGVTLSAIYMEQWGSMRVPAGAEEERELAEDLR